MFQVTFSDQSMQELNKLDKLVQMEMLAPLSGLSAVDLADPHEPLGRFKRGRRVFYRLRSGEHRIYFRISADTLHVDYILHSNTLTDFIFRTSLPISEEQLVEQHSSFWKYLETLKR
jgi:mRNA interferase RelE/StbE